MKNNIEAARLFDGIAGKENKLYVPRRAKNKTVEEIAELIGVSPEKYLKIENGDATADDEQFYILSKYYEVPIEYLKGEECFPLLSYNEWIYDDYREDYDNTANLYVKEYLYQKYGNKKE